MNAVLLIWKINTWLYLSFAFTFAIFMMYNQQNSALLINYARTGIIIGLLSISMMSMLIHNQYQAK